jgi:hypothetical protein
MPKSSRNAISLLEKELWKKVLDKIRNPDFIPELELRNYLESLINLKIDKHLAPACLKMLNSVYKKGMAYYLAIPDIGDSNLPKGINPEDPTRNNSDFMTYKEEGKFGFHEFSISKRA